MKETLKEISELSFEERFQTALEAPSVATALSDLARDLKMEGRSQEEVYDLFLHQLRKHLSPQEDAAFIGISEVMDAIAGHCAKQRWIYGRRL
jgi:hypothetical protein